MPAKATIQCPGCKTPFYEKVPACPVCGHQFFQLRDDPSWDIWFDWPLAPIRTTERAVRAPFQGQNLAPIWIGAVLWLLYAISGPFLSLPDRSWVYAMPVLKSGFVASVAIVLILGAVLVSLLAGLSLIKREADIRNISKILAAAMVPLAYGLLFALLFRVLNNRGVVFPDTVFDWITRFFEYTALWGGRIGFILALYSGIRCLTGLTGLRLVLYSVGFPLMLIGLVLVILALFAAGIFI